MNVKNRKVIRRLSRKALLASRKRNIIAVLAITLTTLLFTSLFTIALSLKSSYESYNFRQAGGYNHGTFKDVTKEQAEAIAEHKNVKETGLRTVIGSISTGVFAKMPAEISFMDANCTKWSYATPTTGAMPKKGKEISMDTEALRMLGITPELGAEIGLTYLVRDNSGFCFEQTDTFILSGYWEYDSLMPVHYINISEEYAKDMEQLGKSQGIEFRSDLNVMLTSSVNIREAMEQVDLDLGYDWETYKNENSVRIGVNWGYTSTELNSHIDPETILSIIAFAALFIFTGYLIIYNIFLISVTGDIRFYGLLKTIGVTPRQLRRIIRHQGLLLCAAGLPLGMLGGYLTGGALLPYILRSMDIVGPDFATMSASPAIFIASALFSLVTVLLSCSRPGRIAGRVSPVEATKYTDAGSGKKKRRATRGAKVHQMAFANLGRNKSKTALVVISLALSVVLLNILYTFVQGFDMEKYLSHQTCADFIVSSPKYFRYEFSQEEYISAEDVEEIKKNTSASLSGCGYRLNNPGSFWMPVDAWKEQNLRYSSEKETEETLANMEQRDGKVQGEALIEGLDESLFEKLTVVDGSLEELFDKDSHNIALSIPVDDNGNVMFADNYPAIGDTLTAEYVSEAWFIDSRTGEISDENTPMEYLEYHVEKCHEIDYTVCAWVILPYAMGFRYGSLGYDAVLPVEYLERDSGLEAKRILYLFDTPDKESEDAAEQYLANLTANSLSPLMYESKALLRKDFKDYQNMFLLLGGALCGVIGLVGILNFLNAILTGILSRRREFAVLSSVGMTSRQLKIMLICEGMFYATGSVLAAFVLSVSLQPMIGDLLEDMLWFYQFHFTITPVLLTIPVFILLGYAIPRVFFSQAARLSVVERLREAE